MSQILDKLILKDTTTGKYTEYTLQDSTLKARVDNLVANAGNTGDNAELIDIRVGEDGTQYPTAGEAIRTQINNFYKNLETLYGTEDGIIHGDNALVNGYVSGEGEIEDWGGNETAKYLRTNLLKIPKYTETIKFNSYYFTFLYDKNKLPIQESKLWGKGDMSYGSSENPLPSNAEYICVSTLNHDTTYVDFYLEASVRQNKKEIEDSKKEIENLKSKIITCWGDSTVEGMGMNSAGNVEYQGDNMPSHLFTLLKDNGYNVSVENYGHGGERTAEICCRAGGAGAAYLSEDITIPPRSAVSIGVAVVNKYQVSGSKLISPFQNTDGSNAQILFTQTGRSTRPLMLGSYNVNLWQASKDGGIEQQIQLVSQRDTPLTIPKYSLLTTGNTIRHDDIKIVHMGINDGSNMSLTEWIKRCKAIIDTQPNTIICGLYNGDWKLWKDSTGSDAEKRENYLKECLKNFGGHFIDLYEIMCTPRCIEIANEGGYLLDRTPTQIELDNAAFTNGHTCPSLTYEGTENEVHFNSIGYYVFAKVLYDKITQMRLL